MQRQLVACIGKIVVHRRAEQQFLATQLGEGEVAEILKILDVRLRQRRKGLPRLARGLVDQVRVFRTWVLKRPSPTSVSSVG